MFREQLEVVCQAGKGHKPESVLLWESKPMKQKVYENQSLNRLIPIKNSPPVRLK